MIHHDKERRRWERHPFSIVVRLIFPKRGIKAIKEITTRLIDISEGGASISASGLSIIPDYFYVEFAGVNLGLISSFVVKRTEKAIHCRFCHQLSSRQLQSILSSKQTDAKFGPSFSAPPPTKPASNSNFEFRVKRRRD